MEVGEAYRAVLEDKLSVERPPLSFAATVGQCRLTLSNSS